MSNSAVSTPAVSSSSERFTGRVKWFNNKAGYGFITVTDGPTSGSDVFVHHSSIKVDSQQYKYLVQGEYVDFTLSDTKTENHEFQAGEVCGIKGGKLMCETRHDSRLARSQYRSSRHTQSEKSEPVKMPKSVSAPKEQKTSSSRDQEHCEERGEWTYVSKSKKSDNTKQTQSPPQPQKASGGRGRGRPSKSAGRGEGKNQSS